jgi:signal transduction histidine kinase
MTLNTRLALLFAFSSAIIISLLSAFVWYFINDFAFEDFYKRLEARVNIAAQIKVYKADNTAAYAKLRNAYLERLPAEKEHILPADTESKRTFDRQANLPLDFYKRIQNGQMSRYRNKNNFYAGKLFVNGSDRQIVIISARDPFGYRELEYLQKVLIVGFFLSVGLSYFVGKKYSEFTFKPIRAIIKKTKGINAENLHERLDLLRGKDEIAEIAATFNEMLDRLETAFETQNNFISNASHELRTPLTIISGEAEIALSKIEDSNDPLHASLAKILSESERLEHILTSLLGLAQSGFDGKKQQREEIRIDELIWDVKGAVDQINPGNNIKIEFLDLPDNAEMLTLKGNLNLLKLAITNIVNNACKYSDNRMVLVTLSVSPSEINITVKDQGIGIPENELRHVFEPFFRASNTTNYSGYGVGLPLSLNIIRLHRGRIIIQTEEKSGTEMSIMLPSTAAGS